MAFDDKSPRIDKVELRRNVLHLVSQHRGEENLILRRLLVRQAAARMGKDVLTIAQWDYFDRVVRKAIEWLRVNNETGALICSSQDDHGGYWIAKNDEELNAHLGIEEGRATTIFQSVQTRRRLARMARPDQMRLELQTSQREVEFS